MSGNIAPFPLVEKGIKEIIEKWYPASAGKVGGDPSYDAGDGFYVWIALVGGSTDEVYGEWTFDVDVFADTYGAAMTHALAVEAAMLERRHVTATMRFDSTSQVEAPVTRPWDDEKVFRVGATYTISGRRSG